MPHQRPDADLFSTVAGWRCPLCNGTRYTQVVVAKPNGTAYVTEFYQCDSCTTVFRHPGKFTRLGKPVRRHAMDVEPVSLADIHGTISKSDRPLSSQEPPKPT